MKGRLPRSDFMLFKIKFAHFLLFSLVHATSSSAISAAFSSHHVQRLSFASLSDPIRSSTNLAGLTLLLLLDSWLHGRWLNGSVRVSDLHLAIVNLCEVVVFNSADSRGGPCIDQSCRSQVPAEFIRVEGCANERSTFSKQLLQVLRRDDPGINASHFQLAFSESALNLNNVGVLVLILRPLLVAGSHDRSPRLSSP